MKGSAVVCCVADISVTPTEGVVPMLDGVDIRVLYTPTRFAIARLVLRLTVSQFNFEPVEVVIVGSCDPNAIRQKHLEWLTRQAAQGIATLPGASQLSGISAGLDTVSSIAEAGGMGASVLVASPDKALVAAVATTTGGGAGGGDAVTKALMLQLKAQVAGKEVDCKLPEDRPPPEGMANDGFRVPSDLSTQIAVNRLLVQEQGKIPIQELRLAIAKQNEEAERQQSNLEADAKATRNVHELLREAMAANVLEVRRIPPRLFLAPHSSLRTPASPHLALSDIFLALTCPSSLSSMPAGGGFFPQSGPG